MNVAFCCPKCGAATRATVSGVEAAIACEHCRQEIRLPAGAIEDGRLRRCLVCPSVDLFVRKDFPQRLGVTLVTIGLVASCVAWAYSRLILTFGILFATALIDVVLYLVVPTALMCYRCGAMYRGAGHMDEYQSFNLETHERYRQQKIRLAAAQQAGAARE